MTRKRNRRVRRRQDQDEWNESPIPVAMMESGRRRSARLNGGTNEHEGPILQVDTNEAEPDRRAARPAPDTKDSEPKRSFIVKLSIATAALRQLEEYGTIVSEDLEIVKQTPRCPTQTETAESLSGMAASSQGTQDQDEDHDFPMPLAMMESGRRRSAWLNGAANDKEEAPGCGAPTPTQHTTESESKRSFVVRLPIATAALRRLKENGIIVSQGVEVVQLTTQSLAETDNAEMLNDSTAFSKPESHTPSKSPPASDITRSPAMSPRLQANDTEYPGDDAPALLPIVNPKLPRPVPWRAYRAFNIALPTDQVMPPLALETQFKPPLAASAIPPRLPAPYNPAPPSMLAEVLEMTRHQARLQVLQSSALRCLSNYHYWSIHNPILSVPYKAFLRAIERELNGELQTAHRNGEILEEMQVAEWMDGKLLLEEATCLETPRHNSVANDHQTFAAADALSKAQITSSESLEPSKPLGPGTVELEITAQSNPKSNATWSPAEDPQPPAVKDAIPLGEVALLRPSPGSTKPAPGPLELAIRAELENTKGTEIRQAKGKGAVTDMKAKAPTKPSANTKKQLRVQVRPAQPGLIDTPPPTCMAGAKNPQSSVLRDSAATEIEKAGTLKDIANVVQQQLEQPSSISHVRGGYTDLIWNPQVPAPKSQQQPQLTQRHYQQQPHQQLQLQQPRISKHAYPPSQYRQQHQLQPQLQLPSVPLQQHPFEQNRFQQVPLQRSSQGYAGFGPSPFLPRKKPWEPGYYQQRDLVLDSPPMPSNWRPAQLLTNLPPLVYYLQLYVFRQQFKTRLQLLSGHLQSPNEPRSRNVNRLPPFASQPSLSNLVLPKDYTEPVEASGKIGFSAFVEPWKCPTADPGARCRPGGNYKILLWQHPLTLDLPTEFLEQGALEPPMRDSSEERSRPRRINRTSHGRRSSDSSFDEAPETTRISSGDESCYTTIFPPHVPTQELVPSTHVVTGPELAGKTATRRSSRCATRPEGSVHNTDALHLPAIFSNASGKQKLVAPVASMYEPPTFAPPVDETPLFLSADSRGESVCFSETDDPWEFSAPMDDDDHPTQTFTGFTHGGFEEPRTSKPTPIINRLLREPNAQSRSDHASSSGIPAASKPKAPPGLATNSSRAAISGNGITPNIIARGPSTQSTAAPGKATYTGPPITIARSLLQKPPTNILPRLTTSHEALPQTTAAPVSRPINLGHLLKNIHAPLPRRNTSLPTSAQPAPSRNRQAGPKITAEDRKKITMLKNAEERRKQREADDAKEVVRINGKGVQEEKERELTGAEAARQIIARKYGEGGAKRIYLTPEEIGGVGGGRRDKGNGKLEDVAGLVLDDRVGHEGELLPIEVAEAMKHVPGKQRRRQ